MSGEQGQTLKQASNGGVLITTVARSNGDNARSMP